MLDIKWIRENKEDFDRLIKKRGLKSISNEITQLDEEKRQLTALVQQLQQARNEKAKLLSLIKDNTKEFEDVRRDAKHINDKLDELRSKLESEDKLNQILSSLPNLPLEEVPYGIDETSNKFIRSFGMQKDLSNPKAHYEIGESLKMMDFAQTAKISGSRFVTLKADLAKLERALINFMLDIHTTEFGFTEVSPPYLVKSQAMYNVGQLPKFAEDSFETTDHYRLIPTGEVPLVNLVADSIIAREELPLRFAAFTPCFRSEAGSAGKDTRGMIRMHQFSKVELVSITTPYESNTEHEFMLSSSEEILKRLDLPYRVVLLCTGEMSFSSQKTYDLEVWLPSQKQYREIASCSNCGDYQARRMRARFKELGQNEKILVHTLNSSGLAIGRTLIAILENYQNTDGTVTIPEALVKYMGGQKTIKPK